MMKKTMPTARVELMLPCVSKAISAPAIAGPTMRERLNVALWSAIAFTMSRRPTISGPIAERAGMASASVVPVPYWVRLAGAAALAVMAGRMDERRGEVLLVVALVLGNASLTMTAFSMLAAIVPLWMTSGSRVPPATA